MLLVRPIYNLNEMAHDATIKLIRNVLDKNINLEEVKYYVADSLDTIDVLTIISQVYVDPVGPSASYKTKLQSHFPGIAFTIEPKADSIYPIVSAASICAKVTRDQIVQNWVWTENDMDGKVSKNFGSGYPADPNTVKWMDENEDDFFGFPSIMRFSWKTISTRMQQTRNIEWSEDEDGDPNPATLRAKKQLKEKEELREKKRRRALKYNHHRKGKVNTLLSLDTTTSII